MLFSKKTLLLLFSLKSFYCFLVQKPLYCFLVQNPLQAFQCKIPCKVWKNKFLVSLLIQNRSTEILWHDQFPSRKKKSRVKITTLTTILSIRKCPYNAFTLINFEEYIVFFHLLWQNACNLQNTVFFSTYHVLDRLAVCCCVDRALSQ